MASTFHLQIVTQLKTVFDEDVTSLVLPGEDGMLGIRAKHAPIISVLQAGKVTIRRPVGRELQVTIDGGFIEMSNNRATLLAEGLEGLESHDTE